MPQDDAISDKIPRLAPTDLVRLSREAIVSWDLAGMITGWNRSAERIFGYALEEAIQQQISKIISLSDPDQWAILTERVRQEQTIEDLEVLLKTKNGREVLISLTLS